MQTSEWLPISSAPKDGSMILIAFEGKVVCAYWAPHKGRGPYKNFPWVCQSAGNAWREDLPTHWMPLPTPPGATS